MYAAHNYAETAHVVGPATKHTGTSTEIYSGKPTQTYSAAAKISTPVMAVRRRTIVGAGRKSTGSIREENAGATCNLQAGTDSYFPREQRKYNCQDT